MSEEYYKQYFAGKLLFIHAAYKGKYVHTDSAYFMDDFDTEDDIFLWEL